MTPRHLCEAIASNASKRYDQLTLSSPF
jgi:hypothetical protein